MQKKIFKVRQSFACRRLSSLSMVLASLLFVLGCLACSEAGACPTCKQGLAANDPAAQAMANGYFYSILFMMSMPFLILGTFGSCAYWSIRRAHDRHFDVKPGDTTTFEPQGDGK